MGTPSQFAWPTLCQTVWPVRASKATTPELGWPPTITISIPSSKDGRAADAEKGFRHLEVGRRVALPDQLACLQFQAGQFSFRTESITQIGSEQGRARAGRCCNRKDQ
jgi:hypothetical protein